MINRVLEIVAFSKMVGAPRSGLYFADFSHVSRFGPPPPKLEVHHTLSLVRQKFRESLCVLQALGVVRLVGFNGKPGTDA